MPAAPTRRHLLAGGARLAAGAALAAPALRLLTAPNAARAAEAAAGFSEAGYDPDRPRPGSTLALRLVRAARFRRRTLTARIAPARDADEAARVAAALSAR